MTEVIEMGHRKVLDLLSDVIADTVPLVAHAIKAALDDLEKLRAGVILPVIAPDSK